MVTHFWQEVCQEALKSFVMPGQVMCFFYSISIIFLVGPRFHDVLCGGFVG